MLTHDFILVEEVPAKIRYTDYGASSMTRLSDDLARRYWQQVFAQGAACWDRVGSTARGTACRGTSALAPAQGLAYHGTSVLTPAMARGLLERMEQTEERSREWLGLKALLAEAVRESKYVLHFGI